MKDSMMKNLLVILILAFALAVTSCVRNDDDDDGSSPSLFPILALGGVGDNGNGGAGGNIMFGSTTMGEVVLKGRGKVDVKFAMPRTPKADLGSNPWVVSRNMTVAVYADIGDANANAQVGERLLFVGDASIYRKEGAGQYEVITGLKVKQGVTLTVGLNIDDGGNSGLDTASIQTQYDVVINGRLMVDPLDTGGLFGGTVEDVNGSPATSRDRGALAVDADRILINGTINTSGLDASGDGDRGGYGGTLYLVAKSGIYNAGVIDASGGAGLGAGVGGNGGSGLAPSQIYFLNAAGPLANRGPIRCNGGAGSTGGEACSVFILSNDSLYNSGVIKSNGGKGRAGSGGNSQTVTMSTMNTIFNRGKILALGGDADGTGAGPFLAGDGGDVSLHAFLGIVNSAPLISRGGAGIGNAGGGAGGDLTLDSTYYLGTTIDNGGSLKSVGGASEGAGLIGGQGGTVTVNCSGTINHRARIDVSGGNGDTGGNAGVVNFSAAEIKVFGLKSVNLSGGAGGNSGGAGGILGLTNDGDVTVKRGVIASGGRGKALTGGFGGIFSVVSNLGSVSVTTDLKLRGGNTSGNGSGYGGSVSLIAPVGEVLFNGRASLAAGDVSSGDNPGGLGQLFAVSGVNVVVKGMVNVSGGTGSGTSNGGAGGNILISASNLVQSKADLFANGGDGDPNLGVGGTGGLVNLNSSVPPTQYQGKVQVNGGDAATPGTDGTVIVDGVVI